MRSGEPTPWRLSPMNVAIPLLVIAVMVTFNALYVAAEFATVGLAPFPGPGGRRCREPLGGAAAGDPGGPEALDAYVAACQIGITLSSLVAGAYGQASSPRCSNRRWAASAAERWRC
jgi:putative hemolysin